MMRQNFLTIVSMLIIALRFNVSLASKNVNRAAVIEKSDNSNKLEGGSGKMNLPLQDINILILTNFHSLVGEHGVKQPDRNADYGDVLSFYQRLKMLVGNDRDLWFVMNGNFVHSSVIGGHDSLTASAGILEHIPYDLVTIGDQELQSPSVVPFLKQAGGLVDWWGSKLLTSNILMDSTNKKPLGSYYKYLKGGSSTILAFGFLGEMRLIKPLDSQLVLQRAEDTIELPWFKNVLQQGGFDLVLVLAHMNIQLERKILKKIRDICGNDILVQFVTGHNSTRGFSQLDSTAPLMETGRSLNTLGFVSFDKTKKQVYHAFINATKKNFETIIGVPDYMTGGGFALRNFMNRTEISAGGNEILGCSPKRFRANGLLTDDDSLLRLYLHSILPDGLLRIHKNSLKYDHILFQSIDTFIRKDLLQGIITMNDVWGVIPHDDTIIELSNSLRGDQIQLGGRWSEGETGLNGTTLTHTYAVGTDDLRSGTTYELLALSSEASQLREILIRQKVPHYYNELVENDGSTIMMRDIWIDFIKKHWPYDGKYCSSTKSNVHKGEKDETSNNVLKNENDSRSRTSNVHKVKTKEKHPFSSLFAFSIVVAAVLFLRKHFNAAWEGQRRHPFVNRTTGTDSFAPNDLELKPMGVGTKGYQDVPDSYQNNNASPRVVQV